MSGYTEPPTKNKRHWINYWHYPFVHRYQNHGNQHYNNSYFNAHHANNNYDNIGHHNHEYSAFGPSGNPNHHHYLHQLQQQQQHHQPHSRYPTTQQNLQNYFSCNNPSRSLSVPEGLSIVSEQCTCSTNLYNNTASTTSAAPQPPSVTSNHRLTRQRSQSLSKPMHVIEQITTSVWW